MSSFAIKEQALLEPSVPRWIYMLGWITRAAVVYSSLEFYVTDQPDQGTVCKQTADVMRHICHLPGSFIKRS